MPLFLSKPKVIDAVQFDPRGAHRINLPPGVEGVPGYGTSNWSHPACRFWVTTKQGQRVEIKAGEWVVKEADGQRHYPIDADEFNRLYEPLPES